MLQTEADYEIAIMQAMLLDYIALEALEKEPMLPLEARRA